MKNLRRHSHQHDKNALKYQCSVANCQFGTIRSDKFVEHMRRHHPSEEAADRAKPAGGRVSAAAAVGPPSLEGRKRRKSSPVATPSLLVAAAGSAAEIKLEGSPRHDVVVPIASSSSTPAAAVSVAAPAAPNVDGSPAPQRARLLKNPFDTVSPPNRTIANFDTSAFVGIGNSSQQSYILSDVALSQVTSDAATEAGGSRAAAEAAEAAVAAAAHAAVESALHTIDDLV